MMAGKKTTKAVKRAKKTKKLMQMPNTSGEDSGSESMLSQQHRRYREEEGEEDTQASLPIQASQRKATPTATVSHAPSTDEDVEDGGEASQDTQPPRKRAKVTAEDEGPPTSQVAKKKPVLSETFTAHEEQQLVEFFASNPIFYDQSRDDFKNKSKKDRLLTEIGTELGTTGKCYL